MSWFEELSQAFEYPFQRRDWVEEALSHSSWSNEQQRPSNERLEFLGDSVLNAAVTDLIWHRFPETPEGTLSRLRARIVDGASLAKFAEQRSLGTWLMLGRGEEAQGGRARPKLLEDAMEALVGVIYLEGGFQAVQTCVEAWFGERVDELDDDTLPVSERWKDAVSRLQEYTQARWKTLPEYEELERVGPDHLPNYAIRVRVQSRVLGEGTARRKKVARHRAAEAALEHLSRPLSIAVDGPASSGKGTVAQGVASVLGFGWVDTGAMYRSVAYIAKRHGIGWDDADALGRLAQSLHIRFEADENGQAVWVDGVNVTAQIRTAEMGVGASAVSIHPSVRSALLIEQQRMGREGRVVMDGRDIGTVVLPDADLKIFLTASLEERARRRHQELVANGSTETYNEILSAIAARDDQDTRREHAPLRAADDAVWIDTTSLNIADTTQRVLDLARSILDKRIFLP